MEQALETTSMQQPLAKARASQPTLLGIPQELRNQIFEHVYQSSSAIGQHIDLDICSNYWGDTAEITSSQTPPSKDPMLVCRQLYSEMCGMYIATYRSFWTTNTFWISAYCSGYHNCPERSISDKNLQHVRRFVICFETGFGIHGAEIDLDDETSSLAGIKCVSRYSQSNNFNQLGSKPKHVYDTFVKSLCSKVSAQDGSTRATMDSHTGQGFTTKELKALVYEFFYRLLLRHRPLGSCVFELTDEQGSYTRLGSERE